MLFWRDVEGAIFFRKKEIVDSRDSVRVIGKLRRALSNKEFEPLWNRAKEGIENAERSYFLPLLGKRLRTEERRAPVNDELGGIFCPSPHRQFFHLFEGVKMITS